MEPPDDEGPGPLDDKIQDWRPSHSKKPSGAENRKRQKLEAKADAEREFDRNELKQDLREQVARLGPPPLNALGNQEWANNVAALLAYALLRDETIPFEQRARLVGDQLGRIADTHSKAVNAEKIAELQKKAGIKQKAKPDGVRLVSVGASGPLRTGGRVQRREEAATPLPRVSEEGDG